MAKHIPTKCDDCEQTDDHPKLHYGEDTYHHDCLPPRARTDVMTHPAVASIVKACEHGLHGDELRAHITDNHTVVPSEG